MKKIIFKVTIILKYNIMSNKRTKRIINEIKELEDSSSILEQSGIYFHFDESNISNIYAMLVGPENTPYEKGFYFFKFEYPINYPMQPPVAKYCTQGLLLNPISKSAFHVRFNPNLYTCGKVCLSMLNTWSGPGWVPTNTISNVLVAIQALVLNDYPLTNEPGFEHAVKKDLMRYNEIISYANMKISVLQMINKPPSEFLFFKKKMCEIFMKNIDYYRNYILTQNDETKDRFFDSPAYNMRLIPEYDLLLEELTKTEEDVLNNDFLEKMNVNSA
jgi:ubiquitin-protein ligase